MKQKTKIAIIITFLGINLTIKAQKRIEYPIIQAKTKTNNSPWYGLGMSNVKFSNTDYEAVQLGGYYGILLKTEKGKFYFHQNGNLGIGTESPKHKLDVNTLGGNFKTYYYGTEFTVNTSGAWARAFRLRNERDNKTVAFGGLHGNAYISTNFDITTDPTGYKNQKLTVASNGNVGIGTTKPIAKLDVRGDISITGSQENKDSYISQLKFVNRFTTTKPIATIGVKTKKVGKSSYNYSNIVFNTSNGYDKLNEKMRITQEGYVGIGTTDTKGYKLAVKGSIVTEEIKVQKVNWADFVFKKDYNLPTLKEVENHIKEKGHLKDIPNAKEVEKNGVLLGEMNSKLLQKIEELTLYTIQQEKKLKKQKNEIEKLKILINKLLEK